MAYLFPEITPEQLQVGRGPNMNAWQRMQPQLRGLLGSPSGGGLLGNQDLALALLANSGYGPKRSFGQVLGQSALQAQQMGQQREDDAFKRQYMQAQMQKMLQPEVGNQSNSIQEFEYAKKNGYQGTFEQWRSAQGTKAEPPADIQGFNLAKDQGFKGTYLEYLRESAKARAQYPYSVHDVNGVPTLLPRINPTMPAQPQAPGNAQAPLPTRPLSTIETEADAKRRLSAAGAAGSELGGAGAKAEFDLPRVESNAQLAMADIDKLIKHPGRKWITGASSVAPIVPGTPQADADALAKKIQGQTFLQAFQSLKGGGAITEIEGQKAEQAIAALSRAQTDEAYVAALNDLKGVLDRGVQKARKQATMGKSNQETDPLGIR
jgi:hypothetical protein